MKTSEKDLKFFQYSQISLSIASIVVVISFAGVIAGISEFGGSMAYPSAIILLISMMILTSLIIKRSKVRKSLFKDYEKAKTSGDDINVALLLPLLFTESNSGDSSSSQDGAVFSDSGGGGDCGGGGGD